jgi:SecD/SecF fusion protein
VIILYLTIRFEYKLALPALLSVVHDIGIAVAVYSVTGREVTSATVAALLTILGYSLYDVVIVFDRIRENVPIMRKSTYREIVNTSVHETLTRSVITSLTTLIPLTVLFFFGGDTLKDFAFALLVGILSGGLSSIAIAAPLAALWKEREPENKRRAVKAERRAAMIASDADVVDLGTLAKAEAALSAELSAEERRANAESEADAREKPPTRDRPPVSRSPTRVRSPRPTAAPSTRPTGRRTTSPTATATAARSRRTAPTGPPHPTGAPTARASRTGSPLRPLRARDPIRTGSGATATCRRGGARP